MRIVVAMRRKQIPSTSNPGNMPCDSQRSRCSTPRLSSTTPDKESHGETSPVASRTDVDCGNVQEKLRPRLLVWEIQVYLLFGCRFVQTVMRMAMAPLLVYICDDPAYECTASRKGQLLASFSFGYLMTQLAGGVAADIFGPRIVISIAMFLASLCMGFTPEASIFAGLDGVWYVTVLLGIAQGPLFPTSIAYLSKWLPASERSWASTMLDSGITVGSLVALPVSGSIAAVVGWQAVFRIYGAMAFSFVIVWHTFSADTPAACWYISDAEKKDLLRIIGGDSKASSSGTASDESEKYCPKPSSLFALLSHRSVWSVFVSHIAFNFGVYFMNSWTPTYYKEQLNLRPEEAVLHFSFPHFANLLVKVVISQRLFDYLRSPACNFTLLGCRRFYTVVGFVGTSMALCGTINARIIENLGMLDAVQVTTFFMSIGMGFVALHPSGFKANYMDLTLYSSGLLSGFGNTLASVASYVGPLVVGHILQTSQSWPLVFILVASINLLAALGFLMFSSATPVDNERAKAIEPQ